MMPGVVAKTARHAAAARFDDLDLELWNEAEHGLHRIERGKRLFVAMPVQQRAFVRQRLQRQLQSTGLFFTREKFGECQRVVGELARAIAQAECEKFVAQPKQARRFESDYGNVVFNERAERGEDTARFVARFVDQAGGEVGSAAAKRAR